MLAMIERRVPSEQRSAYLAALATTRAAASAAHSHFWVFEHEQEPGRFVEFTEAADAASIAATHGDGPPAPLWREVQEG